MVRQVYIAQKMCSVAMFLYLKKNRENTIFVKKEFQKIKKKKYFPVFTWNRHTIVKMESKTKVKNSIELFYLKTKSKSDTYNKFKDFKINGSPAYSKMGIYKIDMNMVVKMFQNLKPKIKKAEENGLESLI